MNTKIYNELQQLFRTSPQILRDTNALQQAIAGTFGVGIQPDPQDNLYELVEQIDEAVLSNYFTNIWQPKTKKYKYSGLAIIDEPGNRPRHVDLVTDNESGKSQHNWCRCPKKKKLIYKAHTTILAWHTI